MAAVPEAGGHTGTDQGGRHQQGEGQDAGAEQMHRHTTGLEAWSFPHRPGFDMCRHKLRHSMW